jgi:CHAT domain-containing protein
MNPELAEAEALILRRLETESPPPSLLALHGRVHLLRSRWDLAIESARTVNELEPDRGDLDLGIAYLARGLALQRPRDLQFAIEYLSAVLSRSARDTVALFNRAIAFEKLYLFSRAESDCEAYLRLDSATGWAGEVRERLRRIREIRANRRKKLEWFHGAEEAYLKNHAQAPPEIFLDRAITDWLPRLTDSDSQGYSKSREALILLAAQLSERHRDPWLSELLAQPKPAEALRSLAAALNANRTANHDAALRHAREARRLFDAHSNFAGSARAQAEEVYALSRSFRSAHDCLQAASPAFVRRARRYVWIEAEVLMDRAVCTFHEGEFETALRGIDRALAQVEASGYDTLYLRGLGFRAAFHTMLGNTSMAALTDWRGLELYWRGTHLPNRAYQFYSDLFMSAEREQRWRSAYAFALEAVDMVTLGSNRLSEAMARSSLGAFALRIGENTTAVQQTQLASALLDPFSDMPSARAYRLENLIVLASAHLYAGSTAQAAKTLATSDFHGTDSVIMQLALHRTRGLVLEAQQQWKQARGELLTAATLAGSAIQNLREDVSRLQWKRESDPVFRALTRIAIDQEHSPETALAFWAWFRSAPLGGQALTLPPPESLVRFMNEKRGMYPAASVVSWAQIGQRLAIWLFDDRGVRFAWSPAPASRCKALCDRFHRLCSQPNSNLFTLRKVGQELYQSLFAPVADHLTPGRVLLLEPDIVPGNIAFEALVHPDGRWLGDHFTMVTSPGFSAELALRERRMVVRRSFKALVVGNPMHTAPAPEFYSPLPDAEREAQIVRQYFSSGRSLLGSAATPRALTASLAHSELFHFAGHASFDGESARLLLAGDGASLDSTAIEEFGRSCRLAVLAACSTAGPDREGPWNADSLVQAFWRAGTPLVIASLWEVDSSITAQLFAAFYTHLIDGENGAESIRQAAAAVRSSPGKGHPYFWAAFHAFGCLPIESQLQEGDQP